MLGIYNGIFYIKQLSKSKNDDVSKTEEIPKELDEQDPERLTAETDEDVSADASLQKAIDTYRKIREINTEITEKELEELDLTPTLSQYNSTINCNRKSKFIKSNNNTNKYNKQLG